MQEERGPRNNKKANKQSVDVSNSRVTIERTGVCRERTMKPLVENETPVSAFRPVFPGSRFPTVSPLPVHTRYMIGKLHYMIGIIRNVCPNITITLNYDPLIHFKYTSKKRSHSKGIIETCLVHTYPQSNLDNLGSWVKV